jgi:hypothetical protein
MTNTTDSTELCRRNDDGTITVFRHEPSDVESLARILFAVREQADMLAEQVQEQAALLGKSLEREARLLGKIGELQQKLARFAERETQL